jgi:PAS domain S-box-containing protein
MAARHSLRQPAGLVANAISDTRLRIVCATVLDALLVIDDAGRFLRVNEPGVELLRAPAEEVLQRGLEHFSPPELVPTLGSLGNAFERRGSLSGTYEVLRGDGSRAAVEFRATRYFDAGEHLIAARELQSPPADTRPDEASPLSARELEVLQVASSGMSTSEIGGVLVISPATVKTHLANVYAKLGVADRTAAVAECLRRGLIR